MAPRLAYSIKSYPNVIILLHGFNSGPGNKAKEIEEFLSERNLKEKYQLIAPQIDYIPKRARRDIRERKEGVGEGLMWGAGKNLKL
tara:strand:+ start:232 stop:489 length:258 start_codon:yes stop_codon:yes gene_type:complete